MSWKFTGLLLLYHRGDKPHSLTSFTVTLVFPEAQRCRFFGGVHPVDASLPYLHGRRLLSEGGRLACVLLPGNLELLCGGGGGGEGFWDGGLVRLLLPLGFLLLKVTEEEKKKRNRARRDAHLKRMNHISGDYPVYSVAAKIIIYIYI